MQARLLDPHRNARDAALEIDRLGPGRAGQFNKLENMLLSDATAVANVDRIVPVAQCSGAEIAIREYP